MELHSKLHDAKSRKKGFLKEMPEEQRRLLKQYAHAKRISKNLLYGIGIWFGIVLIAYLLSSLLLSYPNRWLWNGVIALGAFAIVAVLLLILRSSYRKKADAYASAIPDFVTEFEHLNQSISSLKKAEKGQKKADRITSQAKKKAEKANERAADYTRIAQENAAAVRPHSDLDTSEKK